MIINQKGITLINLVISLLVFSMLILVATISYQNFSDQSLKGRHLNSLFFLLNKKVETLRAQGYWVWDVDTDSPRFSGNSYDPALQWLSELEAYEVERGEIDVSFLRESNTSLYGFSGSEFHLDTDRNIMSLELTLWSESGESLSQSFLLRAIPSITSLKGIMNVMHQALMIYYEENGVYPGSLGVLVSDYLAEIPNDPYTTLQSKSSHVEELVDWFYAFDSENNQVTFYPYSHTDLVLAW